MRRKILFLTPASPSGLAFGGQMRAQLTANALQQLGDLQVLVVSSLPTIQPNEEETARTFKWLPPVVTETPLSKKLSDKFRRAFDVRYLNVHGCMASASDMARVKSYSNECDLTWILNTRTPNILNNWHWPRTHLDVDDLPSAYYGTVAKNAPQFLTRFKGRIQQLLLRRRELLLTARFDTLSVCSKEDKNYLRGDNSVHIIPNGFPPVPIVKDRLASNPRLGFVGLYSYEPNSTGVDWFVENCWDRIRDAVPEVRLRIVGKDTDKAFPSGKHSGIDGLGWISDPAEEMATWSAMIVPILYGGGTRIKIAEAFSRRCPVISTSVGAYGYDVIHGKHIMIADTPRSFIETSIALLKHKRIGEEIAIAAWDQYKTRWTWESITPQIIEAAEHCLLKGSERKY